MKNKHETFIEVAKLFAKNSTCCSKKVGCCIVKDDRIIATGYNGVPKGGIHCEDLWKEPKDIGPEPSLFADGERAYSGQLLLLEAQLAAHKIWLEDKFKNDMLLGTFDREKHHEWSKKNEIHAEVNALAFCAKNGIATDGADMYLTLSPCVSCALQIIQSGIKKVYFDVEYDKDSEGIKKLKEYGIVCKSIESQEDASN